MTTDDCIRDLIDAVTAPGTGARIRHDRLVAILAPLGAREAHRHADAIEAHAYWVRVGTFAGRPDVLLDAEVEVAAYSVCCALTATVPAVSSVSSPALEAA